MTLNGSVFEFDEAKKSNCDFEANCVVHEHSFDRLYDIALFLKESGIENVRFSPLWSHDFEAYHAKFKEAAIEQIEKAKTLSDETFEVGSTYEKYFVQETGITTLYNVLEVYYSLLRDGASESELKSVLHFLYALTVYPSFDDIPSVAPIFKSLVNPVLYAA